ncbi:family 10 glycosylhydrolase [Candidatus Sumerlaeota bacterium]|nr:family 10 glycosylhydrolase [Candidatus Sumerlaeota bacterium]
MRGKAIISFVLFVIGISVAQTMAKEKPVPEYRMCWILTFEGDVINSPAAIKQAVDACREANLNAIIPVVRRRGRTYYKSKIEPFYNPHPEKPINFDSLAEFIKNAHDTKGGKQRIEVHGWFIVSPVWLEAKSPPPGHILGLHPNWMSLNFKYDWQEKIPQSWLDPGVPEVEDYIVSLCKELVSNYEIDGLNLDYIRYREGGFGYNPRALKRFQERFGRSDRPSPQDEQWNQWRREQVTNLVRRIFVETKKIRPALKLSVCAIPWGSPAQGFEKTRAYYDTAQDWIGWAKEGIIDINIPMIYRRESIPSHKKAYRDWTKLMVENRYQTRGVVGLGAYLNSIPDTIQQIKDARTIGADGFSIFRLVVNNKERAEWRNLLTALKKEVTPTPAPVPEIIPFNKRPYGILCGKIYRNNKPADSVKLTLVGKTNRRFSTMTSGAGYYAFVKVSPGKYTLMSESHGKLATSIKIKKGKITTQDIHLR